MLVRMTDEPKASRNLNLCAQTVLKQHNLQLALGIKNDRASGIVGLLLFMILTKMH